jgi:hypothetical protein
MTNPLRGALASVIHHWDEFGYEANFEETIERARKAIASPAETAQPVLWTQCIFTGDPPPEYADWHAFINAPVKSGVTVTATGITAEPPMEQKP